MLQYYFKVIYSSSETRKKYLLTKYTYREDQYNWDDYRKRKIHTSTIGKQRQNTYCSVGVASNYNCFGCVCDVQAPVEQKK